MTWEKALLHAQELERVAAEEFDRARRRHTRLKVAIRLIKGLIADGVPFPDVKDASPSV